MMEDFQWGCFDLELGLTSEKLIVKIGIDCMVSNFMKIGLFKKSQLFVSCNLWPNVM